MTKYVCVKCKTDVEVPECVTCGFWICPKCGAENEILGPVAPTEDKDWLGNCIPFTGVGADQTTGVIGLQSGVFVEDLVKSVIIFDDETEDGLREIKKKDLKKDDKIANLKFWEARVPPGVLVVDVNGKAMTREAWFYSISPVTGVSRQTDGLAIWASKKLRRSQTGGGVQVQQKPGSKKPKRLGQGNRI
jgi:hypothetical protein